MRKHPDVCVACPTCETYNFPRFAGDSHVLELRGLVALFSPLAKGPGPKEYKDAVTAAVDGRVSYSDLLKLQGALGDIVDLLSSVPPRNGQVDLKSASFWLRTVNFMVDGERVCLGCGEAISGTGSDYCLTCAVE
jgi:hypothetical protein